MYANLPFIGQKLGNSDGYYFPNAGGKSFIVKINEGKIIIQTGKRFYELWILPNGCFCKNFFEPAERYTMFNDYDWQPDNEHGNVVIAGRFPAFRIVEGPDKGMRVYMKFNGQLQEYPETYDLPIAIQHYNRGRNVPMRVARDPSKETIPFGIECCKQCGIVYERTRADQKFCSGRCRLIHHRLTHRNIVR